MILDWFKKFYCTECNRVLRRKDLKKWDDCRFYYYRCTHCGNKHVRPLELEIIDMLDEKHKHKIK